MWRFRSALACRTCTAWSCRTDRCSVRLVSSWRGLTAIYARGVAIGF